MASDVYANAKYLAATDSLEWGDGAKTFRALLVDDTYTFNHVQTTVADVLGYEVSDPSYSRQDVVGRTVSLDLPGNRALLDATDVVFTDLGVVIPSGLIIYKQFGGDDTTPGDDLLICFIDFPPTPASGSGFTYLIEFDPDGVIALTTC